MSAGASHIIALKNINLSVKQGQLTVVVGDVGSGKSSLLYAILGEMKANNGARITLHGSVAFMPQNAWVLNATIEQNIIMAREFDE